MGKLTASQKAARQEGINNAIGKVSGVMSGVSGILGSAMQNAQINDTSGFEDNIDNLRNTNFDVGDYDTLMSVYNPLALNNRVTFGQVRGGSTAGRVGNVLSATANGAMTGATFGPWGALAGAATGLAAGIGGWIAGDSKAKSRVDELNAENHMASNEYINKFSANAERIGNNMFRNKILNIAALGGLMPNKFAFGGLQPDYSNGATLIRNGGKHESNPYEGVQVGLDQQGVPNLVEEGEVIYDDYVYSNRLKPTKKQLESILLPIKYYGKTYAEIAKDIQSRSDEMPNDPIERAGLEDGMYKLRAIQDETKQREEQRRFMREFNKLSDDDKFALINGINQEVQQMQQQRLAEEQQLADMQSQQGMGEYDNQPQPNQEAGIASQMNQYENAIEGYAYGGNLFGKGGKKNRDINFSENITGSLAPWWYYSYLQSKKIGNDAESADMQSLIKMGVFKHIPRKLLKKYNKSFSEFTNEDLFELAKLDNFYSGVYDINGLSKKEINDLYNEYSSKVKSFTGAEGNGIIIDQNGFREDTKNTENTNEDDTSGRVVLASELPIAKDFKYNNTGLNENLLPISGSDEFAGGEIQPSIFSVSAVDTPQIDINDFLGELTYNNFKRSEGAFGRKVFKNAKPLVDVNSYITQPEEESVKEKQIRLKKGKFKDVKWRDNRDINNTLDRILKEMGDINSKESARRLPFTEIGPIKKNIPQTDELPTNNPTWLRYMPLLTSTGAVIGDLFGANKPDYSIWDNVEKAANRLNYVSPTPIGDYLSYNPYDVNYMQGRINAQNAMAQRNILNTAGSNRGAAISGILASQQQGLNNMSDMYRQALEYNDKQRQAVADFNRGTNQTNAQMSLQAQAQNAQLDRQRVSDLMQLAAQKQNIRNASQEAIAGNLTNLATLAGQYGKESVNINQLNRLINSGAIRIGGNTSRNGGKLKRRRR